jgi:pimeloyl-ACP methyl ester carboxylesterase
LVSHTWLIKAIGFTILAALICGYITLCLLFYQGQWQLVLHPQRTTAKTLAGQNTSIHFGPDESATPQLTGMWLPAAPGARYAKFTIVFLPDGDGSLSDFASTLSRLHDLGLNVFAFDYRGYGHSADTHPDQLKMTQDADSAWSYLTTSRAIPPQQIVPYGAGLGAAIATRLAAIHPSIPALILDSPKGDLLATALRDPRSSLLPVRLLFHEHFPLAQPLSTLPTPKLLIFPPTSSSRASTALRTASDPKVIVEFASPSEALYNQALNRFLDQYLPVSPPRELVPSPVPLH